MTTKSWLPGSVLAAVGASLCCVAPLVLVGLGIGGAWLAYLHWFEPFRPYFIGATLLFLGLGFRSLYLKPQECETGAACAVPEVRIRQRAIFWVVSIALLALIAVPWMAPLFY